MPEIQPQAYSLREFAKAYGICRTNLYNEINAGRLASYLVGRKRYISATAGVAWQNRHETAETVDRADKDALTRRLHPAKIGSSPTA